MRKVLSAGVVMVILASTLAAAPAAHAHHKPGHLPGKPKPPPGCPEHPYPCGGEWPAGLEGPFELAEVTYVKIPSFDGTLLEGWIGMPAVPDGVDVPVVLAGSPYHGACFIVPRC